MTKRQRKQLISLIITLLIIVVSPLILKYAPQNNTLQQAQPGLYRVTQFDDGDTIVVDMNGVQEKVRFIGVDTPETKDPRKPVQCFGKAASAFTQNLIGSNDVRLEADIQNTNRDRYNRLLRYVYLPDGTLVNAKIIEEGYGFAYTGFPFSKMEEFKQLQTQAREQNRGLWSNCTPTQNTYGGFTSNDDR